MFLAMADFFVDAFFAFVADHAEFFALYWLFVGDFCFDCHVFDCRLAYLGFFAVDNKQRIKSELFCAFREEVHQEGLFFGDEKLLTADFDDCFFHRFL